jgi:hypothetical protein
MGITEKIHPAADRCQGVAPTIKGDRKYLGMDCPLAFAQNYP